MFSSVFGCFRCNRHVDRNCVWFSSPFHMSGGSGFCHWSRGYWHRLHARWQVVTILHSKVPRGNDINKNHNDVRDGKTNTFCCSCDWLVDRAQVQRCARARGRNWQMLEGMNACMHLYTELLKRFTNMKKQSPSCLKWRFPITWSIQGRNPFSLSQTFDQSPCHWSRPPIGLLFFPPRDKARLIGEEVHLCWNIFVSNQCVYHPARVPFAEAFHEKNCRVCRVTNKVVCGL